MKMQRRYSIDSITFSWTSLLFVCKAFTPLVFFFGVFGCSGYQDQGERKKPSELLSVTRGSSHVDLRLDQLPTITDSNKTSVEIKGVCVNNSGPVTVSVRSVIINQSVEEFVRIKQKSKNETKARYLAAVVIGQSIECSNGRFSFATDLSDLSPDTTSINISVTQGEQGGQTFTDSLSVNVSIGLILSLVTVSPGKTKYPTVKVSGLSGGNGRRVNLYSDPQCTQRVGAETIPTNGTSVDITACNAGQGTDLEPLSTYCTTPGGPGPGNYTFYARIASGETIVSDCSSSSVTYTLSTTTTPPSGGTTPPSDGDSIIFSLVSSSPGKTIYPTFRVSNLSSLKLNSRRGRVILSKDPQCGKNKIRPYSDRYGSSRFFQFDTESIDITLQNFFYSVRESLPYLESYGNHTFYAGLWMWDYTRGNLEELIHCSSGVTYTLVKGEPLTSISLSLTPMASPPGTKKLEIRVSGLSEGDNVTLTTNRCDKSSLQGSAQVPPNRTSVDIKITKLPSGMAPYLPVPPGTYTFYPKVERNGITKCFYNKKLTYTHQP